MRNLNKGFRVLLNCMCLALAFLGATSVTMIIKDTIQKKAKQKVLEEIQTNSETSIG